MPKHQPPQVYVHGSTLSIVTLLCKTYTHTFDVWAVEVQTHANIQLHTLLHHVHAHTHSPIQLLSVIVVMIFSREKKYILFESPRFCGHAQICVRKHTHSVHNNSIAINIHTYGENSPANLCTHNTFAYACPLFTRHSSTNRILSHQKKHSNDTIMKYNKSYDS
jgi:hypothetical protein